MAKKIMLMSILSGLLLVSSGFIFADDQEQSQERVQTQEQIYASQLMTKQERAEYHAKIGAAKTEQERERIRKEHHERMKVRAKARGLSLPDKPPARNMWPRGGSMGSGGGRGR